MLINTLDYHRAVTTTTPVLDDPYYNLLTGRASRTSAEFWALKLMRSFQFGIVFSGWIVGSQLNCNIRPTQVQAVTSIYETKEKKKTFISRLYVPFLVSRIIPSVTTNYIIRSIGNGQRGKAFIIASSLLCSRFIGPLGYIIGLLGYRITGLSFYRYIGL